MRWHGCRLSHSTQHRLHTRSAAGVSVMMCVCACWLGFGTGQVLGSRSMHSIHGHAGSFCSDLALLLPLLILFKQLPLQVDLQRHSRNKWAFDDAGCICGREHAFHR